MKNVMNIIYLSFLMILAAVFVSQAQDIQVITHEVFISDTVGSEMVFNFEVVNISNQVQTVFEVRTVNDLPQNWQSSLCFGEHCFAPQIDSIATTQTFSVPPLNPGDTLITSLHVYAMMNNGTGYVQIQVGTFNHPNDRITLNFTATTQPEDADNQINNPEQYYLEQNHPNPFNPSTVIKYGLKKSGFVTLNVYDVLGNKVATLVNGFQLAGDHQVSFDASNLSSGFYFYKLTTGNFTQTRKMILEK